MGVPGIARLAAAAILTFAVLGAQPPCALACSCIVSPPLAQLVKDQPELAVVAGTVGVRVGNTVPFLVERWYHGQAPAGLLSLVPGDIRQPDGTIMADTCGRMYETGQRLILVGSQTPEGFSSSNCLPGARLDTADGAALAAEAQAAFGEGAVPSPATASPAPEGPDGPSPGTAADGAGLAAAIPNLAVLGGLGAVFVGLAYLALRRARREG